jgi:superfamily II DNA or RNA helicase
MLKDCDWSLDGDYKSGSENEPLQFYLDGLTHSSEFNLLLGYFSSSAISLLSVGFATFISRGGKMRMVINHLLSEKDKETILKAENNDLLNKVFDLNDIVKLEKALDKYSTHFFECLAYLIAQKRIEIKVIKPKSGKGISHYKSGVFSDGENHVKYKASCNFTLFGLSENLEELEASFSWEDEKSKRQVRKQLNLIDKYFTESDDDVEYLSTDKIEVVLRDRFGKKDIDELIVQEEQLLKKKMNIALNPKLKRTISKLFEEIDRIRRTPRFPYSEGPRDYQKSAYENWVANNYSGVFAMATGTGKTITSMNCVLNEYHKTKTYKAIILVPTLVLVDQWVAEAINFNFTNIITVSSKNAGWKDNLNELVTKESFGVSISYILISTYKSFTSEKFQSFAKTLNSDEILIADEAHNIGARNVKSKLPFLKLKKKIGLSATPNRAYDPEGTKEIETFFGDKEPYTYNFSMERAIEESILSKYYYYPKLVSLQDDEMTSYNEISLRIARLFQKINEDDNAKKQFEMLLIQRKNIIHKAKNKFAAFKEILNSIMQSESGLKYTLVYAPEGYHSDDVFVDEEFPEVQSDSRIIDFYSNIIRTQSPDTHVAQYISSSDDKQSMLQSFEKGKIDLLLSMKCLDEGVDIPRTEQAIFCSSSGNPRQFIQRRGRILRKHPDKKFAKIFDMVVIPIVAHNSPNFDSEKKLVYKEMERVIHFAYMAINKYEALEDLKYICDYYNLNLDTIHLELKG